MLHTQLSSSAGDMQQHVTAERYQIDGMCQECWVLLAGLHSPNKHMLVTTVTTGSEKAAGWTV
jgi:hypothetical protein